MTGRLRTRALAGLLVGLPLLVQAGESAWTASWGTALMETAAKPGDAEAPLARVTLRQAMRLSLGGEALRVRFSNLHGEVPLVIGAASLARAGAPGSAELAGPVTQLRFGGAAKVTLAPGAEILSDPLRLPVAAGDLVALSLYVESGPAHRTVHLAAHATGYAAPGEQAMRPALEGARSSTSWFQVAGIEVLPAAPPAAVLAAIGDSITDGSGAGLDADERWTDFVQRRLRTEGAPATAVVNAGIGGNRMLREGNGPSLLARFERDVLERPGVTHALVLIGVNDLGRLHKGGQETPEARQAMLDEMQAGWRKLASQAHARGVCLFAGTLTPYGASRLYRPGPGNEADRQSLNAWLRGADFLDGVADFDAAVRDPAAPDRLQSAFDSGDGLHLSPAGYRAMAGAVPVDRLGSCRWRKDGKPASAPGA
jgi:lysophospholipase L1-like esterase